MTDHDDTPSSQTNPYPEQSANEDSGADSEKREPTGDDLTLRDELASIRATGENRTGQH